MTTKGHDHKVEGESDEQQEEERRGEQLLIPAPGSIWALHISRRLTSGGRVGEGTNALGNLEGTHLHPHTRHEER